MTTVGVYLVDGDARMPTRSTQHSACWDVHAHLLPGSRVEVINEFNEKQYRTVQDSSFTLFGGERALIGTGCVFDIPQDFSLRLHPRSGLAWKQGISLVNCEGVIDSDYINQTMIAVINHTEVSFVINHGDRIAQMELVPVLWAELKNISNSPTVKSDRRGGFGSTGVES